MAKAWASHGTAIPYFASQPSFTPIQVPRKAPNMKEVRSQHVRRPAGNGLEKGRKHSEASALRHVAEGQSHSQPEDDRRD
jgi:hypothetical protein